MNWFDIFIVIILLRTSYKGFKEGLSVEIYRTAGFCLSGLAALYFYKPLSDLLSRCNTTFLSDTRLNAISFTTILLLVIIISKLIFMLIKKIMQLNFAENFDVAAGLIVGFIRGVVISSIIFILFSWSAVDYLKESVETKSIAGIGLTKINSQIKGLLTKKLQPGGGD